VQNSVSSRFLVNFFSEDPGGGYSMGVLGLTLHLKLIDRGYTEICDEGYGSEGSYALPFEEPSSGEFLSLLLWEFFLLSLAVLIDLHVGGKGESCVWPSLESLCFVSLMRVDDTSFNKNFASS